MPGSEGVGEVRERDLAELLADVVVQVLVQIVEVVVDVFSYRAILVRLVFRVAQRDVLERDLENIFERNGVGGHQKARASVFAFAAFHDVVFLEVGDFLAHQNRVHVEAVGDEFRRQEFLLMLRKQRKDMKRYGEFT